MIFQVFFGEAQTGLGYQFFSSSGSLIGSRVTTGIVSLPESGGYLVDVALPGTAVGIFWDSTETPDGVSEDLREALREGAPTVEEIADAVWDEAIGDHQAAGSTGAQLQAAGSGGDPWLTVVPGEYADGTAGAAVGRLNNTPAENPIAVVPVPPEDPDLCAVYLDTENILGEVVTDLVIEVDLESKVPVSTVQGRLVKAGKVSMTYDVGTPGRYTIVLETGLTYRVMNLALFGNSGKVFELEAGADTFDLGI